MGLIINCWTTDRGFFDFASATSNLKLHFPQHHITWAVPSNRAVSRVLKFPQSHLVGDIDIGGLHQCTTAEPNKSIEPINKTIAEINDWLSTKAIIRTDARFHNVYLYKPTFKPLFLLKNSVIETIKKEFPVIFENSYTAVHIRLPDIYFGKQRNPDLEAETIRIAEEANITGPVIFVTNSVALKELLQARGFMCTPGKPTHSGWDKWHDSYYWALDVLTLQRAQAIKTISKLHWAHSCFSLSIATMFDIPYECLTP